MDPKTWARLRRDAALVVAMCTVGGGGSSVGPDIQLVTPAWLYRRFEQTGEHDHGESYINEPPALDLSSAVTTSLALLADTDFQLPRTPIADYGEATRRAILASMAWRDEEYALVASSGTLPND